MTHNWQVARVQHLELFSEIKVYVLMVENVQHVDVTAVWDSYYIDTLFSLVSKQ